MSFELLSAFSPEDIPASLFLSSIGGSFLIGGDRFVFLGEGFEIGEGGEDGALVVLFSFRSPSSSSLSKRLALADWFEIARSSAKRAASSSVMFYRRIFTKGMHSEDRRWISATNLYSIRGPRRGYIRCDRFEKNEKMAGTIQSVTEWVIRIGPK
jgi:hypothetical protein